MKPITAPIRINQIDENWTLKNFNEIHKAIIVIIVIKLKMLFGASLNNLYPADIIKTATAACIPLKAPEKVFPVFL